MSARPLIDSLDFARNGREISGSVPVSKLPRLQDMLENSEGTLDYTVHGGADRQGIPYLDVSMTGSCRLRCQRCLGAKQHAIAIESRLLLRSQKELDALDESDDGGDEAEHDSILAEASLDVLDMLEEEILLSLPISPRHEEGECAMAAAADERREGDSPFAVLAKLK